ncbi:stonustoxin subunit alpha-like [Malaclemys terrapin pileata]|uniref:stonustoxin subunit alpha-like n=1 Tax=Malaclemys terrapin pileata TaxID=2991368 RepID=UPI0023A8955A|nr:stonustoxin subunit alpha-like [Malaclemys terrapin pileata]XP_053872824.1 stonustoxin subunit alpha-like [Malaclemys terrapin pileata]XP_053872825.1 stonustoxin subunit alpha-like [Malaclemys terrapin pileata]XP_053872826.1 stonustoxin subunit alpha-like [Malaclemys terrapin pileata]
MAYSRASTIEMPALGRPLRLGMLYDCRSDTLIPGITLWGIEALKKDVETMPKHNTEFQIIASDSIEDKASALRLSGSLKASLLGGLVEVGGSAAFLNDTKKSKYHARVALHYSATNRFEHLTMSQLGTENVSYPAVFDQGTATHVVTAVLYGAQAFFVFDREVSSSESMREIEGEMKLMVEKILKVSGGAEVSGKKGNRAEEKIENFSCTFYGDFALENNPVTYQDAMGVYSTLPKRLGVAGENAVPVRVWLYPLSKLDPRAAQLVREISAVLVYDAQSALEHLTECDVRCNDMVKDRMATTFPEIQRKIQQFRDLCKQHRQTFQKELARTLPSIRGGGAEERALVEILTNKEQSPFGTQRLNEFLEKKQEEMDFVNSYLAELENVEVVSSRSELQRIVLSHRHNCVVCLALTSLHNEESYLSELNLWLRRQFMKNTHVPALASSACETPKSKQWFEDEAIKRKARQAVKSFSDFAHVNKSNGITRFIVASVLDKDNPGASIYLYEDGDAVSTNFEFPAKPFPLLCDGIIHDRVQLTFNPAAAGRAAISGYQTEYRIVGQENWTAVNVSNTQETFTVTGLRANTEYQFRYAAVSKPGLSESSDVSDPVKTLSPTSPPGKPVTDTVDSSAISLSWESPSVTGDGVSIREYKVEYKEEAGDTSHEGKVKWLERRTEKRTEFCTIDGLRPETPYRFRVSAVCADGAVSDPSEETLFSTLKEDLHVRQTEPVPRATKAAKDAVSDNRAFAGLSKKEIKELQAAVAAGNFTDVIFKHQNIKSLKITTLNVAVTGESGSGKSSFVNNLRGLNDDDEGAAETGVCPTTMEPTPYQHPKHPSVTIWDLPGFGSCRFPINTYVKSVNLNHYDVFIFMFSGRFTSCHQILTNEIWRMGKKCYYVRSKVDTDLCNASCRKSYSEQRALQEIRDNCIKQMKGEGETSPQVFLINRWDPDKYDFPLLQETLEKEIDQSSRCVMC